MCKNVWITHHTYIRSYYITDQPRHDVCLLSGSQLTINRAALVRYIRVQHVENHVENFWISVEVVHNDQTHPFGKNYVRMMRKTFCMCPFGRFWIKSLKEKLWSKKYFFYIRFRCPRCFSDICSHLPHLLFLIFRSRSIDMPT